VSSREGASGRPISDSELDGVLRTADANLAAGLERVMDTDGGCQAIVAGRPRSSSSMSDLELDAVLSAADADLAAGLDRVMDTDAGSQAITARTRAEAMRNHPAGRGNLAG
jgi:hypothetical protein